MKENPARHKNWRVRQSLGLSDKNMQSSEIREKFLKFFEKNGHTRVASSSLVPEDDPTLLFTNAGMNQFKKVFLGLGKRDYSRATSSQKCIRAGGKHNDLENVGLTTRHHTFFEMLGNFSFGDYFKAEAIAYAWEFCVRDLNLPKEKIYITIFKDDTESEKIWKQIDPILKDRIYKFGEKDNFWSMGETGPCGPCSELVYDQGEAALEKKCSNPDCSPGCECDRYVELWNLVFMQFNKSEDGKLVNLPAPSVDTGMGLERTVAVLQKAASNFDTDLFLPLIRKVEKISGNKYTETTKISFRVIADHIRALTFAISDGVIPSNEGRGYVIRRILRRAARHGRLLGLHKPFLSELSDEVVKIMGKVYPDLENRKKHTQLVIQGEEERFEETLDLGLALFEQVAEKVIKAGKRIIPGEEVFKLYDTYGFPVDLTSLMVKEKNLEVDMTGFEKELEKQRIRSKEASRFFVSEVKLPSKLIEGKNEIEFVGYEKLETESQILDRTRTKNDKEILVLNITPFYAEAGGQVGDTGQIKASDLEYLVYDTQKDNDLILHFVQPKKEDRKNIKGTKVLARVDAQRRLNIMRNHTATHLLHKALREILGEHVHQEGSLVAPDHFRFDFTHFKALDESQLKDIEYRINQKIWENLAVEWFYTELERAKKMGAMALFGEKYEDRVRVIRIGDYSLELCGGTHTRATGEIGIFKIISESAIGAGLRRIEALTGEGAYQIISQDSSQITQAVNLLKTDKEKYLERLEALLEGKKQLEKKLKQAKAAEFKEKAVALYNKGSEIEGVKTVFADLGEFEDKDEFLSFIDSFTAIAGYNQNSCVGLFSGKIDTNYNLVCVSSPKAVKEKNLNAGEIVKELAKIAGGSGGGKPSLASAGIKDPGTLEQVFKSFPDIIKKLKK